MSYRFRTELVPSGQDWLGRVPQDWKLSRLGTYFKARNEKVSDTEYPPLSVTMKGIVPQLETAAKTDAGDNRKRVCVGDFVINSRSDRKGSSGVSGLDGSVSLISIVLEPKQIQGGFVHHLLRSYPFQEEFYRFGKGIVADLWSTNYSEMKNIIIPVPSPAEQTTIANFLDRETAKIDELIEKQERLIALLEEKRQAVISHAVTKGLNPNVRMKDSGVEWLGEVPEHWGVCKLCWVSRSIQTGPFGSQLHSDEYVDGGTPLINPAHIVNGELVPENKCSLSDKTVERLARHKMDLGDIVFARRGEMGRCAPIVEENVGWLCGTGSLKVSLKTEMASPQYLFRFLTTRGIKDQLSLDSVGSTMENLNTEILGGQKVALPPLAEQKEIVKHVQHFSDEVGVLIGASERKKTLLKERRTALISAAVTGKIDVRGLA